MTYLIPVLQIIIALGLLNVWLLRSEKATSYRGGAARSLKEEFTAYGLPTWFYQVIRFLKISSALFLLVGIWIPDFVAPAAALVCFLMIGALGMHIKVKDPFSKSLPALGLLVLSAVVLIKSI